MGEMRGRFFIRQITSAVEHLHQIGIAHRDLKLENFLVNEDMQLMMNDFGSSTNENISTLNQYCGTRVYMAPEIILHKTYDGRKADIFSVGVILFILVQGGFPFLSATEDDEYFSLLIQNKF